MAESTFTLRVDEDLKQAFTEAARKQDRSGAQMLRDFMRETVQRARSSEEYEQWFRKKVEEGRAELQAGMVLDNDAAEALAARRREELLSRLGGSR